MALPVKFNSSVYYAYDAEYGKNGKQINQLHIYCFLLSDNTEKETPATASMTTTASPERISARRFISRSISPARMIPPNTSFEISVQYFPISANSVFFLSSVIVPVVCLCKDSIFEQKGKQRDKMRKKMHIFAIPESQSNRTESGCNRKFLPFAWWQCRKRLHGIFVSRGHLYRGHFYFLNSQSNEHN